jgi:hypothetical protein
VGEEHRVEGECLEHQHLQGGHHQQSGAGGQGEQKRERNT